MPESPHQPNKLTVLPSRFPFDYNFSFFSFAFLILFQFFFVSSFFIYSISSRLIRIRSYRQLFGHFRRAKIRREEEREKVNIS